MTMATGVYGTLLTKMGTGSPNFQLNASDTVKLSLVTDTHTPDFDSDGVVGDIDNEVTGTGWAAAQALGSPTWTIDTGNTLAKLDGTDVSASTTTLADIEGVIAWDDTVSNDDLLCAIDFGQTYQTTAGTLAITWSSNGLMYISY